VSAWRRGLAAAVDGGVALVLAALLASTTGMYFAERAAVTLRVGQPGSPWKGVVPMLLGAMSPLAYGSAFALLLVWSMEALFATSPGKLLWRAEIVPRRGGRGRLWARFAIKASGAWLLCLAFVAGMWPLAALAVLAGAAVLLGACAVPFGRRAPHDVLAGTTLRAPGERP
jgi:hypothetical protein